MFIRNCRVSGREKIGDLLSSEIPKDFLLDLEAKYASALEQAWILGSSRAEGHRISFIGINRHYLLNEAHAAAFKEAGYDHVDVRGNRIIFGSVGIATVARVHLSRGPWDNSKRSAGKRKLCERNVVAAQLVQPDFLVPDPAPVTEMTVFFVTEGDGSPSEPAIIHIVVPNSEMDFRNPLFVEPLGLFLQRYEKVDEPADRAFARLKPGVQKAPPQAANDDEND